MCQAPLRMLGTELGSVDQASSCHSGGGFLISRVPPATPSALDRGEETTLGRTPLCLQ